MNCSDVQNVLPEIIDNSEDLQFHDHLKSCPACAELVADLRLIAAEARPLAEAQEPPARLWVRIAAEARAEGLIREPRAESVRLVAPRQRWKAWWLAPVAAALIVGVSYFSLHKPAQPVAIQSPPATVSNPPAPPPAVASKAEKAAPQVTAAKSGRSVHPVEGQGAPMAMVNNGDDSQFLSRIGRGSPDMRATFENQLAAVNSYIRDAEAYLRQNPGDVEARQQLMDAYEQKAMLYQMALDHVQ